MIRYEGEMQFDNKSGDNCNLLTKEMGGGEAIRKSRPGDD